MNRTSRRSAKKNFKSTIDEIITRAGGIKNIFPTFSNTPSCSQLEDMFVAGKYGGKDPLFSGGIEFALEYAFDEFNRAIKETSPATSTTNDFSEKWCFIVSGQDEPWGNMFFSVFIDKQFQPYISELKRKDFEGFTERPEELIDSETKSIVFDLKYCGIVPEDVLPLLGYKFAPSELKSSNVHNYSIWIASPDLYAEDERKRHFVSGHLRHLKNGKIVEVSPHERRNKLIETKVPWDNFDDYIVYLASDSEDKIRYVGEGRPTRPNHVNSGISHNFEINKHFFLRGPMKVAIIEKGLTKPTALAIEKLLIRKFAENELWNIKDNPEKTP